MESNGSSAPYGDGNQENERAREYQSEPPQPRPPDGRQAYYHPSSYPPGSYPHPVYPHPPPHPYAGHHPPPYHYPAGYPTLPGQHPPPVQPPPQVTQKTEPTTEKAASAPESTSAVPSTEAPKVSKEGAAALPNEGKMEVEETEAAQAPSTSAMANLMSIVVGSGAKKRPSEVISQTPKNEGTALGEKPSASAAWETRNDANVKVEPKASKAQPAKRRRRLTPVKKVLVARKERDMAVTLLHDKRDLASFLSPEECKFLGEHFWIFTHQQLSFALNTEEEPDSKLTKSRSEIIERMKKLLAIAIAAGPEVEEGEERQFHYSAVIDSRPHQKARPSRRLVDSNGNPVLGVDTDALRQTIVPGRSAASNTQTADYSSMYYSKPGLYEAQQAANAYLVTGVPGIGYSSQTAPAAAPESNVTELYSSPTGIQEYTPPKPPGDEADETSPYPLGVSVPAPDKAEEAKKTDENPDPVMAEKPEPEESEPIAPEPPKPAVKLMHVKKWKDEDWSPFVSKAEAKIEDWRKSLKEASSNTDTTKAQERFKLDGAIAFLFPLSLQNFIKSVPLNALYDFMELKKTETGAVCDLIRLWREKCELSALSSAAIAKHLLGVATRMELAISSIPPVSRKDRRWVNDPIIVMTGASQEFLIGHLNITAGKTFVQVRTKDLSTDLVKWRETRGMPPLKGSGKVAMISGWKAAVKDAIEAEDRPGRVLVGVDLLKLAAVDNESATRKPVVKELSQGKAVPERDAAVEASASAEAMPELNKEGRYALHSPLLLYDALGGPTKDFLKTIGIGTASELLECNRVDVEKKIVDGDQAKDAEDAKKTLVTWFGRVRHELKQFEVKKITVRKTSSDRRGHARRIIPSQLADPIEALSAITQSFLASMQISSAEDFLSSRTTDIANEFVKFRIRQGMPELKGLGAIASVSGWKAQCRKVAKRMGMEDVSKLEPDSSVKREVVEEKPLRPRRTEVAVPPKPSFSPSREDVLSGKSRCSFVVQSNQGDFEAYKFEVSLRAGQPRSADKFQVFLTYKGAAPGEKPPEDSKQKLLVATEAGIDGERTEISILPRFETEPSVQSPVDPYASYSSRHPGSGCLELSPQHVRPFEDQDLSCLHGEIMSFVMNKPPPKVVNSDVSLSHNVVVGRTHLGRYAYYFYAKNLMEKGEICKLSFLAVDNYIKIARQKKPGTPDARSIIDCALNLLSRSDLLLTAKFLDSEVLDAVNLSSTNGETQEGVISRLSSRKRIDWLYRRTVDALGSDFPNRGLFLGKRLIDIVPAELRDIARGKIVDERRADIMSALPLNAEYSAIKKDHWCTLLENMQQKLTEVAVGLFDTCADWEATQKFVEVFSECFKSQPEVSDCDNGGRVLCFPETEENSFNAQRKPVDDIGKGFALAHTCYQAIQLQLGCLIALHVSTIYGREGYDFEGLVGSICRTADAQSPNPVKRDYVQVGPSCIVPLPEVAVPAILSSYQYFLCLVWPSLRKQGWRMELGDTPDDVAFVTPSGAAVRDRQSKSFKLEQQRKRVRLSSDAYNVGLGSSMKLTRRLCIATSAQNESSTNTSDDVETSTQDIADQYLFQLQESLEGNPPETQDRAGEIVASFVKCFDEVAPTLPNFNVELKGKTASAVCGGEYLVQFLFILPTILRQSKLPLPHVNRSLDLAQDMIAFVTKNYKSQLPEKFCPSVEVYSNEVKPLASAVATGLRELENIDAENGEDSAATVVPILTETVLEDDKPHLTDFIVQVLSQSVPCRATDEDMTRKYRRIHVGFPGLMCRHCRGKGGEGRYFFTSSDSVATAATVFEKHVAKCSAVPTEIKQSVVKARERHTEQRKSQPQGLQHRFFIRLWERLRSSNIEGELSGALVFPRTVESLAAVADYSESKSFTCHIEAMEFVRPYLPDSPVVRDGLPFCKRVSSLADTVNQYYHCIDYGARTYGTPSMPKHFSEEWLLSKIVPRRKAPKRIMAG